MRFTKSLMLLFGAGQLAQAQEARVSATTAFSSHELFSRPGGVAVAWTVPSRRRVALRIMYSILDDTDSRVTRACAGLIPPDQACPEEPVNDATSFRGVTFGLVTTVKRWRAMNIVAIPSVTAASIRSSTRGRQTGNSISSSEPMLGVGGGAEIVYRPSPQSPWTLHAGAQIAFLGTPGPEASDTYEPFGDAFRLTRLDLGVSVGRRPRR